MTEQEEFVARERRFWEAGGDPDFYRENFAEDGRCVFGMGILDKARAVGSMEGAPGWDEVEMDGIAVIHLADDVRAITYAAQARSPDGQPYEANIASVYVHRDGDWLLALHSQAPATPT